MAFSLIWRTRSRVRSNLSRSEEHTSELQSRLHLVCRLRLEKKKKGSLSCLSVSYWQSAQWYQIEKSNRREMEMARANGQDDLMLGKHGREIGIACKAQGK